MIGKQLPLKLMFVCFLISNFSCKTTCETCSEFQENALTFVSKNKEKVLEFFVEVCRIVGAGNLCDYTVKNFGEQLTLHKFDFMRKTHYFCDKILKDCSPNFGEFNFTDFKSSLEKKYPKLKEEESQIPFFPKSSQKKFNVLVLNDIHIQNDYLHKSKSHCKDLGGCCSSVHGIPDDKQDQAGFWGTPKVSCDMPGYFFSETLKSIKNTRDKPDFIVLLGDNVGHQFFRQPGSALTNATEFIFKEVKGAFPDTPVIPVLGNHECHPVEYLDFSDYKNWVYENIVNQFGEFIPSSKIEQFKEKGYFTREFVEQNLKFISINSQILDGFNVYMMDVTKFGWNFLDYLACELHESEQTGQKVIILNHIEISDYFSIKELNKCLIFILDRFQNTIISYLSAHTHNDQLRFMKNENKRIFAVNYVSPAITTYCCYNPSYRIYEYGDDTLQDYRQYNFDIDKHNKLADEGDLSFKYELSYSFVDFYGMKNTGKEELQKLHDRLISRDDLIVEQYVSNYYCQKKLPNWLEKRDLVLCELSDDIKEIYRCLFQNTMTGAIDNFPPWIYQKLLVSDARIEKEDQSMKEA